MPKTPIRPNDNKKPKIISPKRPGLLPVKPPKKNPDPVFPKRPGLLPAKPIKKNPVKGMY